MIKEENFSEEISKYFGKWGATIESLVRKEKVCELTEEKISRNIPEEEKALVIASILLEKEEMKLLMLAKSDVKVIQIALALNSNINEAIIDEMVKIGNPTTMIMLLENNKTTKAQMVEISKNKHFAVKERAKIYLKR